MHLQGGPLFPFSQGVQPVKGEEQMRARLLAVGVTALVLVLVLAAPALAGPREEAQARRKAMAGDR